MKLQGGKPMSMIQALRSAMDVMLGRDDNVIVFGQDAGYTNHGTTPGSAGEAVMV